MRIRFSALATSVLIVVAVLLMSGRSWAWFFELGPSKGEWGLKYDGEVNAANGDKLNVVFTLADQGRLKPIYSVSVIAFSNLRPDGGRTYLLNTPIDLKPTKDGKLSGQVEIGKEFADRAVVRILTQTFDGKPQTTGARYYDIPLKKFQKKAREAASSEPPSSIASPPVSNVTK